MPVGARRRPRSLIGQRRFAPLTLPAIATVSALSLILIDLADERSRLQQGGATGLFWVGLIGLFVPAAARLVLGRTSRRERIGAVIVLGLGLYLVNVVESPVSFTQFAEMDQLRTLNDIGRTHHLFSFNPIAPVNSVYPGLSLITSAVMSTAGVSAHTAGVLVVSAAHLVLVLSLFKLFEEISGSDRIAGIATALYATNPDFLQFSTQFSYESLGLALFALILLGLVRHQRRRAEQWSWYGVSLFLCAALVVTHHMTSFILVAVLAAWTTVTVVIKRRTGSARTASIASFTVLAGLALAGWLAYAGGPAIAYLADSVVPAVTNLIQVVTGQAAAKVPFHAAAGTGAPVWERLTGFASIAMILLGLPFGIRALWRRHSGNGPALLFAAIAIVYPASLGLRLSQAGAETSNRSSDFVFLGLGFVLALMIAVTLLPAVRGRASRALARIAPLAITAAAALLFVGGITIGTPLYARQPGPYLVGADSRSVEPQGLDAAAWLKTHAGTNNKILTDRSNRQVMGSYGDQLPQQRDGGKIAGFSYVHVSELIFSPTFGSRERQIIRNKGIRYVVIDRRLSRYLPLVGVYFEKSEPGAYQHTTPIPLQSLEKFDTTPGVARVLDEGDIIVYDVSRLAAPGRAR